MLISTEDTTPGKPQFNLLKEFSNAILVGWQPPENAGLVCITGYKIEWGENSPYQVNVDLSSDKTQYLIKGLGKFIAIFTCFLHNFNSTVYLLFCNAGPQSSNPSYPNPGLVRILNTVLYFLLRFFAHIVYPSGLS